MKQALFILALFCSASAFGQKEKRYKWIILDTIIVADNYSNNTHHFMLDQDFCHIRYETKNGKDTTFKDDYYEIEPEYGATFFLKEPPYRSGSSETMQVYLPENVYIKSFSLKIDDKGSIIIFKDLPEVDTFHIPKWTIHHNCLPDSLKSHTGYYHNDSTGIELYKEESEKNISKTGCDDTLKSYSFTMNEHVYSTLLTITGDLLPNGLTRA